jgi:hypothetical protein
MHRIRILAIFLIVFCGSSTAQEQNDWSLFESATFKEIFVKEFFTFKSLLTPSEEIQKLEGQELVIIGYYIPVATKDNNLISSLISRIRSSFCSIVETAKRSYSGPRVAEALAEARYSKVCQRRLLN